MKLFVIIQLFIFIFFLNSSIVLSASIYRWVDENGVRNFSNLPDSVPASVFYNRSVEVSDKYISRLPLIEKSIDSTED
ncbi:MAG: DUF4124 domain-containing protein, partial [Candidatus Dadabacteria bacterium]|nr:DUF4124 domain-containing protein [Candidatus Dadabacteria bacterium]